MLSSEFGAAERLHRAGFALTEWPTVAPEGTVLHRVNALGESGRIEVAAPTRSEALALALAEALVLLGPDSTKPGHEAITRELAGAGFAVDVRFTSAPDGVPRYDLWGHGPLGGFFVSARTEDEAFRLGADQARIIADPEAN